VRLVLSEESRTGRGGQGEKKGEETKEKRGKGSKEERRNEGMGESERGKGRRKVKTTEEMKGERGEGKREGATCFSSYSMTEEVAG
jgi:hypothetical protein